jgi:hypothetical protein
MNHNYLRPHRMEELSEQAEYYAETYCAQSPVILPQDIAAAIGLSYSLNDYGNAFDGRLEYKGGHFHAFLNSRGKDHLFNPRTRFTFAHELGHYLIEEHRNALLQPGTKPHASFTNFLSDNMAEMEADFFAGSLLMPKGRMLRDTERRKFEFTLVDEIALKYNVSITAALLKFMAIDRYPMLLVCTRNCKIAWYRYSPDFPFKELLGGKGDAVPDATVAGDYFYRDIKYYKKTETVFAEDWFVLRYSSDRRRPFNEHCVYFEEMKQVVSVVWE